MALTISSEDCRNSPNPTDHSQMANSSWNIGEVIALSLGLVLVFALCFGFRIWWGRRRDKRRKQQEREGAGDVEAPPPDSEAQNGGRPQRNDGQGLVLIPFPPENSRILGTRRDGGREDDGAGQIGGQAEGHEEGGHVESGHGAGGGGGGGGDGGGGWGGNGGAGGTN